MTGAGTNPEAFGDAELLRRVLDTSVEGLQVVDPEGRIVLVNESFLRIHKLRREEAEGRPVTEVIENTRMHVVARTGVAELDEVQRIDGQDYVVSRIPILKDGRCLGAVGKIVFRGFKDVQRLALKVRRLQEEVEALRRGRAGTASGTRFTFDDVVAFAESSAEAKERAVLASPTDATVLLLGESGVGKEVYAHAIHNLSPRHSRPFVRVNCSAITETLLESELFGYEEGAFTGARRGGRMGRFEAAHTGTIFLDEIGDMPLAAQSRLLRVLQEREVDRVGGEGTTPVDIRVIASTNQDLRARVAEGRFRLDLFYRLDVIPIVIPPLRERRQDIPALSRILWAEFAAGTGRALSEGALRLLEEAPWPGNIRELRNVLERTSTILRDPVVSEEQLRWILQGTGAPGQDHAAEGTLAAMVEEAERRAITLALARSGDNRAQAARLLGVSRPLLYRKLKAYAIG
jgi:PAS domain S-box-containing protein